MTCIPRIKLSMFHLGLLLPHMVGAISYAEPLALFHSAATALVFVYRRPTQGAAAGCSLSSKDRDLPQSDFRAR